MITQCPQSPKTHQVRSSSVGRAGFGEQKFVRCNSDSAVIAQGSRDQSTRTRLRPVQMSTAAISLLTLGTASFLYIANRTTLERMGLAATRGLESCMQLYETT